MGTWREGRNGIELQDVAVRFPTASDGPQPWQPPFDVVRSGRRARPPGILRSIREVHHRASADLGRAVPVRGAWGADSSVPFPCHRSFELVHEFADEDPSEPPNRLVPGGGGRTHPGPSPRAGGTDVPSLMQVRPPRPTAAHTATTAKGEEAPSSWGWSHETRDTRHGGPEANTPTHGGDVLRFERGPSGTVPVLPPRRPAGARGVGRGLYMAVKRTNCQEKVTVSRPAPEMQMSR